jgi:hypothetical protein
MPPRARKSTDAPADPADPADEANVETVEEVSDEDAQRYADTVNAPPPAAPQVIAPTNPEPVDEDDHTTWPQEESVAYKVPHVARSNMATQLLEAADELGYPVEAIRSQTDGFLVPSKVYYHLFPSQIPEPVDEEDGDEDQ